jgi:SNF2 family DNA or RNA helicase
MDSLASLGITSTSSTTYSSSSSSSPGFTGNNIKANRTTTKNNNKKPIVLDDTPESSTTKRPPPSRPNPFSKFAFNHSALEDTSDDDDDSQHEQIAIQLAIKNSLADATTTTKKKKIVKKKQSQQRPLQQQQTSHPKKKQPALVVPTTPTPKVTVLVDDDDDDDDDDEPLVTEEFLNDSSSEEENDDDDEVVVEEDSHEHKVATSVLETAASLSAQVLATMNQWARTTTTTDGPEASHGLIVNDGAMSLGTISTTSLPPNAQWISQETMQQACPGVTLSKYQLIGVNWLALLHGMKCTLEQGSSSKSGSGGGKKDTPVNGVLADEMGLVRDHFAVGRAMKG